MQTAALRTQRVVGQICTAARQGAALHRRPLQALWDSQTLSLQTCQQLQGCLLTRPACQLRALLSPRTPKLPCRSVLQVQRRLERQLLWWQPRREATLRHPWLPAQNSKHLQIPLLVSLWAAAAPIRRRGSHVQVRMCLLLTLVVSL